MGRAQIKLTGRREEGLCGWRVEGEREFEREGVQWMGTSRRPGQIGGRG